MENVNIIIGRFQPFTNGHLKCIEEARYKIGVPTVICMVDTKDDKVDERKPFPSSLLLPLYRDAFEKYPFIKKIVLVTNADIVKIGELLAKDNYKICSWTCGTDRYDSYKKMADKYGDKAGLSDDFQMIEVKRSDDDISATKVRQALLDNDKRTFDKLTPFGSLKQHLLGNDSIYEVLRRQINKIMNND